MDVGDQIGVTVDESGDPALDIRLPSPDETAYLGRPSPMVLERIHDDASVRVVCQTIRSAPNGLLGKVVQDPLWSDRKVRQEI
jgi:hypothetical protein